jgi:hypothetical protein
MKAERITREEILAAVRASGAPDAGQVAAVVLEPTAVSVSWPMCMAPVRCRPWTRCVGSMMLAFDFSHQRWEAASKSLRRRP